MPGVSGVTVVTMLVCFFISHTRLRAHRAPGIPCALCFPGDGTSQQNSRGSRGEIAKSHPVVIARHRVSPAASEERVGWAGEAITRQLPFTLMEGFV